MRREMDPQLMALMTDFALDMPRLKPKPAEATHDKWTDDNGVDWWVHRWTKDCTEYGCAIHAPTDHEMVDWPQIMAPGTLVVRICKHDYQHPDPDSLNFFRRRGQEHMGVHACDGCCDQRPKRRGGETITVETSTPAVNWPPGYVHKAHDCDVCNPNPYGYDIDDIPNGS